MFNKEIEIKENTVYLYQLGTLMLYIKKNKCEWFLSSTNDSTEKKKTVLSKLKKAPKNLKWDRIILHKNFSYIKFMPSLPDSTIVIESKNNIRILKKQKNLFFIEIPCWIKIFTGKIFNIELFELQSFIFSKTWSGSMNNGLLSYSISSDFKTNITSLNNTDYNIICPLTIKNYSKKYFDFTKLSIYSNILNIYQSDDGFITNETYINYFDENKINININKKDPGENKSLTLITNKRNQSDINIFKLSYNIFKSFAGF